MRDANPFGSDMEYSDEIANTPGSPIRPLTERCNPGIGWPHPHESASGHRSLSQQPGGFSVGWNDSTS